MISVLGQKSVTVRTAFDFWMKVKIKIKNQSLNSLSFCACKHLKSSSKANIIHIILSQINYLLVTVRTSEIVGTVYDVSALYFKNSDT